MRYCPHVLNQIFGDVVGFGVMYLRRDDIEEYVGIVVLVDGCELFISTENDFICILIFFIIRANTILNAATDSLTIRPFSKQRTSFADWASIARSTSTSCQQVSPFGSFSCLAGRRTFAFARRSMHAKCRFS